MTTDVSVRWTNAFAPDILRALEERQRVNSRKDPAWVQILGRLAHFSFVSCSVRYIYMLLNFPIPNSRRTISIGRLPHHRGLKIGTSLVSKETEVA